MTALILAPYSDGSPKFPDEFTVAWQLQRLMIDANGQPVQALLAIDTTSETCNAIQANTWPTIKWVGNVDPVEGRYLNVVEAAEAKSNNAFAVKLDALTHDGYTDPVLLCRIKGDDRAMKERWTPQTVSVLNMKALGAPGNTQMTTFDFEDKPITMTLDQFQQLMMRYSIWFYGKFAQASAE